MNEMMKEEVVVFKDGEFSLVVNIDTKHETVLLSANQMALLFDRTRKLYENILIMFLKIKK